jgi:NDP-sugar pyrophosphorylase family protein
LFPRLAASGRIYGFPLSGYRCAVDSPERLAEAGRALESGLCRTVLKPALNPVASTKEGRPQEVRE